MPALMGMMMMVVGSFVAHVLFGAIVGGVAYVGAKGAAIRSPTRETTVTCPACGGAFHDESLLMAHAASAHSAGRVIASSVEEAACPVCRVTFAEPAGLAAHRAIHQDDRSRVI